MSRRCPRCKTMYAGEARFCPRDGSPLVDVGGTGGETVKKGKTAARTEVRKATAPKPSRAADAGRLTNQVIDGRYEVVQRLGEGGMSYVYEAKDMSGHASVAIKVLSPKLSKDRSSVERLRREAGLAMRLEHPNACKILRLGETEDGLIYLVMPYLKGELLSDREVKGGPMDPDVGVRLLVQILAGLEHAHGLHIIHRDLKPENVMLVPGPDGQDVAVVMDFGLAKENRADSGLAKLTATGIILGTPEFMSPEQIRGRTLDARSDVYAVGVLAFEMFTGKLPFEGRTPQEMMIARLRGKPLSIKRFRADFPDGLAMALMKSLETEPNDRFGSAREFALALIDAHGEGDQEALRRLLR